MAIKEYSFTWQPTVDEQIKKAREEFNRLSPMIQPIQSKVLFIGMGLFETKVNFGRVIAETFDSLEMNLESTRVMIPISLMKRMGIIKRSNGSKTVTEWLNTSEGSTWLGFYMMKKERGK